MTLVIPGRMPGLNEYVAAMNIGRHAGNAMKQRWTVRVRDEALIQRLRRCEVRQDIRIKWFEPNRKRDKDNVSFAAKFILDGLVLAGVLQNDGWRWVGRIDNEFAVDRRNPRVEVTLTNEQEWA